MFSSSHSPLYETFPAVPQLLWPAWGGFGFDGVCLVCVAFEVKRKHEDGIEQRNELGGSAFL